MNGSTNSRSARPLINGSDRNGSGSRNEVEVGKKKVDASEEDSEAARSLGDRVRAEVRSRLGRVGDELFDDDEDSDVEILEQEEVIRGTRGLGALWKMSLMATLSFAAYMLFSGSRVEARWVPNIIEKERIPKIYRPRKRHPSSSMPPP